MENIIDMDELESFVLEFLAYRRERKMNAASDYLPAAQKRLEYKPDPSHIPYTIGQGWPHYRDIVKTRHGSHETVAYNPQTFEINSENDIIHALSPIVAKAVNHIGPPTSQKALEHLVNQVIANAMALPQVSESIRTAEIVPWGRFPLLQAVIELLIRNHT